MQKKVLEAALFMSNKPLMLDELGKLLGLNSLGYVKQLIQELQKDYSGRGIEIVSTPHGWQMQVRPELVSRVSHLTPYSDMSEGVKRTLALIVYKEPALQSEIIHIQGNKAYSYIKELRRRGLINIEKKSHTKIITLTKEFERYFGEEKEKIRDRIQKAMESGQNLQEPEAPDAGQPEPRQKPEEGGEQPESGEPEPKPHESRFRRIDVELE